MTGAFDLAVKLTAAGDITYYALYSRLDTAGSGTSSAFELFSGKLEAGNYLITHNNGALAASVSDKGRLNYLDVIPVGNAIDEPDASIIWEIRFTDDGYVTLVNAKEENGVLTEAEATAIDDMGRLEVRLCSGETLLLSSGEVSIVM